MDLYGYYMIIYIYMDILYIWVNYNDLTVLPKPGIMVYVRKNIPKWPNYSGSWIIMIYPD